MFGRSDPADVEIRRLEGDITKVRFDQVGWQFQLEEYVAAEVRSMALLDSSRAGQSLARRKVEECAQAISSLQDEIAALLPPQPGPVD